MKPALQNKLYARYPDLFIQKDLSMKETCMCWGISVADGWYGIIDSLCRQMMEVIVDVRKVFPDYRCPEFVQVKEKFGTLRIYLTQHSHMFQGEDDSYEKDLWEEMDSLVRSAEHASLYVCEHCGTTVDVETSGGWLVTLCNECREKRGRK